MTSEVKTKGYLSDLQFAFQFRVPARGKQIFNAYEYSNTSMVLAASHSTDYDVWSIYSKYDIFDSFKNGEYETNVSKEHIKKCLEIEEEITTTPQTTIESPLQEILSITTKSDVQVAIVNGCYEVYADCLADPVKVYTEQDLMDMLKAILILEKTYAGK